ncbi:MAG: late competence development ComFB family protein [Cyanobacteria bacterium SID2]|nr:late competence development ComFB family protein [Cyanobacteria bacterium SID2]MBP0002297.1 late competence development ComFB family protein [Cyanobacteria bacterium SBC]
MTTTRTHSSTYHNAMEPLASVEVERQLQQLPPEVARSIDPNEAIAYALNRLPPLYATTIEGWHWNQERGHNSLQELITLAASWGIREAQRKQKPFATPLPKKDSSETALRALQVLLERPDLNWHNLIPVLEERFHEDLVVSPFDRMAG